MGKKMEDIMMVATKDTLPLTIEPDITKRSLIEILLLKRVFKTKAHSILERRIKRHQSKNTKEILKISIILRVKEAKIIEIW